MRAAGHFERPGVGTTPRLLSVGRLRLPRQGTYWLERDLFTGQTVLYACSRRSETGTYNVCLKNAPA